MTISEANVNEGNAAVVDRHLICCALTGTEDQIKVRCKSSRRAFLRLYRRSTRGYASPVET
jgi:hypothetical protein